MDEEEEDDDEVAEDEDLTSPHGNDAPQHGHAAATPPTQETDVIARLLAAAKYADEDPERLDIMRALKNQALADKRQAEHSRDFWHEEANKARSRANGLAAELADTKEALRVDGSRRQPRRYAKEHRGAAWTWPLWIVQLVLEHLVNGVPPTSIPAVIRSGVGSMSAATTTWTTADPSCAGRRAWSQWCRMEPTFASRLLRAQRSMRQTRR
jgi:hypothetical protein